MGTTDALLSGQLTPQYFEKVVWPESDLDIFVREGDKAEAQAEYLRNNEGCTCIEIRQPQDVERCEFCVEVSIHWDREPSASHTQRRNSNRADYV